MRSAHARAKDPVCGMSVDPTSAEVADHGGRRHYFCSSVCAEIFRADPDPWAEPMEHAHGEATGAEAGTAHAGH